MISSKMIKCRSLLKKYIPITDWLPRYSLYNLQCDIIAGVTVGLMVIPQALAYASIARLSNDYGLYSSFMGCFVYCIFGTSKDLTIGPTAILSLIVATYNIPGCGDMAVLMTFCVGVILLLMGIFRLGFLVQFVSVPVISAFTSAAAVTIAFEQLKSINGLNNVPKSFFAGIINNFKRIKEWNFYDVSFGLACFILLILMRCLTKLKWQSESLSNFRMIIYKGLWLFGIARNAFVVLLSAIVMYLLDLNNIHNNITCIDDVEFGLPRFVPPPSTFAYNNQTYKFDDSLKHFGTGLAVVPLLAFMEAMAIGKAFSRANNYKIVPNQELIALGFSNIFGSFVSSYPVTGSFSRTAVNSQSGVRTPLGGLFTGTIVILAIAFLTEVFKYIPKACLGAVIVSAVIHMLDVKIIKSMWKVKKLDLIPYIVTLLLCFYELEVGLIIGMVCSLLFVLYPAVNPLIEQDLKDITVLRIRDGLLYPGVEKLIETIEDLIRNPNPPIVIMLDFSCVNQIDFSVVVAIKELLKDLYNRLPGTDLVLTNVCADVKQILKFADLESIIRTSTNINHFYPESNRLLP